MKTLTKKMIIDYLTEQKPLIEPSQYVDLNTSNDNNVTVFFLAVTTIGYLTQNDYNDIEWCLINALANVSNYSDKVIMDKDKSPYFLLKLEINDTFLNVRKYIMTHALNCDNDWSLSFKLQCQHTLFFESLDVTFYQNGHAKPVRLGFDGFGGLGLKESLFKGLPLFYYVDDFERDKCQEIATTLTYGDLLRAQRDGLSRRDLLIAHLKTAKKLDGIVNYNKFTVTELYLLVKVSTELDDKTFINFVKWYRNKGRYLSFDIFYTFKSQRRDLIAAFILYTINKFPNSDDICHLNDQHELYYTAKDYYLMCKSRRRKLKINFSSERALNVV